LFKIDFLQKIFLKKRAITIKIKIILKINFKSQIKILTHAKKYMPSKNQSMIFDENNLKRKYFVVIVEPIFKT
jgi:hypothetical protein